MEIRSNQNWLDGLVPWSVCVSACVSGGAHRSHWLQFGIAAVPVTAAVECGRGAGGSLLHSALHLPAHLRATPSSTANTEQRQPHWPAATAS